MLNSQLPIPASCHLLLLMLQHVVQTCVHMFACASYLPLVKSWFKCVAVSCCTLCSDMYIPLPFRIIAGALSHSQCSEKVEFRAPVQFRVSSPLFAWYCGAVVSEPNTEIFTKFVAEISEAVNFLITCFPKWVIKVVRSSSRLQRQQFRVWIRFRP